MQHEEISACYVVKSVSITDDSSVEKIRLPKNTFKYWAFINTVMNMWCLSKGFELISRLNES